MSTNPKLTPTVAFFKTSKKHKNPATIEIARLTLELSKGIEPTTY
jgi:hypothetical protein